MAAVSPTHSDLANSTKQMQWRLSMYNTACGVSIQKLPYARVRQLVKLDGVKKPLEQGQGFPRFQSKASPQMHRLMDNMTHLCRDAASERPFANPKNSRTRGLCSVRRKFANAGFFQIT